MAWPAIQKPSHLRGQLYKKQFKSSAETGRVKSRAAHLSTKLRFTLTWASMTQTDLDLLFTAFNSDQGKTFTWNHPWSNTAYTMAYANNGIEFELSHEKQGHYQVVIELEER